MKPLFAFIGSLLLCIYCDTSSAGIHLNAVNQIQLNDEAPTQGDCNLVQKIIQLQRRYIKDSYGIYADEGFTDIDERRFLRDSIITRIRQELSTDSDFQCIVSKLKKMSAGNRQAVFNAAYSSYRRSWRYLKLDPSSASKNDLLEGQTDAGSRCEKLIAEAVTRMANQFVSR